jgi:hypothetical protein
MQPADVLDVWQVQGNVDALFDLSAGTATQTLVFRRHDEEDTRTAERDGVRRIVP